MGHLLHPCLSTQPSTRMMAARRVVRNHGLHIMITVVRMGLQSDEAIESCSRWSKRMSLGMSESHITARNRSCSRLLTISYEEATSQSFL